jgi:hypothetical protein
MTNWLGVRPVVALNEREKCAVDSLAIFAS